MRISEIPRSQQYIYFQNKALHYQRLQNMKPAVDARRSPKSYRYTPDASGYLLDLKMRHTLQQKRQQENEDLRDRLINIVNSSRVQVGVQGYSKYNFVDRSFTRNRKDKINRDRNVSLDNYAIADRLTKMKPEIGDTQKWNKHSQRFFTSTRMVSKFNENHVMKSKIQIHGDYIPKQFSTILNDDDLKRISETKRLDIQYDRLMKLPKVKASPKGLTTMINQKSQSIQPQISHPDIVENLNN